MPNPQLHFCDIYLVRHGETDWNVARRIQGHSDIPLNSNGEEQARSLKSTLSSIPFAAIFSSDLIRAKQTAEIFAHPHSLSVQESQALRERCFGSLEGLTVTEIDQLNRKALPILETLPKHEYLSYKWHPEVETSAEIYQRVSSHLHSIIPSFLGSSILVVSHSGVVRSVLDHFDFSPNYKWIVANCGFLKIRANAQQWSIEARMGISNRSFY